MKTVIRVFFKTLRIALGPFMLFKERITQPQGVQRDLTAQAAVDLQCQSLALYQFKTCPFCIKVRQEIRRLSLPIEMRDAQHNVSNRNEMQQACGTVKVPCLKITETNGQILWLQDSNAIVAYLRAHFQASAA